MKLAVRPLFFIASIFFVCLSEALAGTLTSSSLIRLKSGHVRGRRNSVPSGQDVDLFLGIPFAQPPTGELRFAAPRSIKPWNGVLNATEFGAHCPQGDTIGRGVLSGTKKEDCLVLNIYRPADIKENSRLSVMVWIHGGGLYHGSGSVYDGSVLASYNDVIVVTFNYRLGLLGFLNIPGTELTGNYGMLDQVLALKWVQENIGSFGGNPDKVTIFGESSGGSSVDLHIISPLSKGLFQKAIAQSGFATTSYETLSSKTPDRYFNFAEKLNCLDKKQMLYCLRKKTVDEIIKVQGFCDYLYQGSSLPAYVVDGFFLPDKPWLLLSKGQFNPIEAVMLGANNNEGVSKLHGIQPDPNTPPSRESFLKAFNKVFFISEEVNELTKQAILYEYTNHTEPDSPENLLRSWRDIITDSWYFSRMVFSANNYVKAGIKTHLYQFSHSSTHSTRQNTKLGVHHFDDVQYIFGMPWKPHPYVSKATTYTDVERGLSITMMRLWTNFAKYGNPSNGVQDLPSWPQYNTDSQEYLNIDLQLTVKRKMRAHRVAFWNELVPQLNNVNCQLNKNMEDHAVKVEEIQKEEL